MNEIGSTLFLMSITYREQDSFAVVRNDWVP